MCQFNSHVACRFLHYYWMWKSDFFGLVFFFLVFNSEISNVVIVKFTFYFFFFNSSGMG